MDRHWFICDRPFKKSFSVSSNRVSGNWCLIWPIQKQSLFSIIFSASTKNDEGILRPFYDIVKTGINSGIDNFSKVLEDLRRVTNIDLNRNTTDNTSLIWAALNGICGWSIRNSILFTYIEIVGSLSQNDAKVGEMDQNFQMSLMRAASDGNFNSWRSKDVVK